MASLGLKDVLQGSWDSQPRLSAPVPAPQCPHLCRLIWNITESRLLCPLHPCLPALCEQTVLEQPPQFFTHSSGSSSIPGFHSSGALV